ncbi:hypothetical protein C4D60_Mb04t20690 [Musa balbisiana]|uniref:Uncharacterized protein n=1 Tax=Musa balbisiana TaxID=52838 RepID=A0A4S8KDI9_MUSBA|nr:hypothetical protein C4D60_Mb04t20690 [Musa balbisiana]
MGPPNAEYREITIGSGLLDRRIRRLGKAEMRRSLQLKVRTLLSLITKLLHIRARMVLSHSICVLVVEWID